MKYVLDTSALIIAWSQWYRIEIFPTIWGGIEQMARDYRLTVPDAAFRELEYQENDLHDWLKKRKEFIINQSNDDIQNGARMLRHRFPLLESTGGDPGRHFADPFVIATAQYYDANVVSHEHARGEKEENRAIKIPDICAILGIEHIMFHRIIINEGWVFGNSN